MNTNKDLFENALSIEQLEERMELENGTPLDAIASCTPVPIIIPPIDVD